MSRNRARQVRGRRVVAAYRQGDPWAEPLQHLVDALADLRHYAQVDGLDFDKALRISESHFQAEASG